MKAVWLAGFAMLIASVGGAQTPAPETPLQSPVCAVSGKWKGQLKGPILTSADGHRRLYGWMQWDRPGKWTGQRCEAAWWVFASRDGSKFMPILVRQDFLQAGQQASLGVVGFSAGSNRAAADVMTVTDGHTTHGYFVGDLAEHTSCMGSATRGLDGVRAELNLGFEPMLSQPVAVRDDGWLELRFTPPMSAAHPDASTARTRLFEPCSGKLRAENGQ